jgi:DNA excision repair protein ERCC-3
LADTGSSSPVIGWQFRLWTNLEDNQISRFTSGDKEHFKGLAGITVSTYNMVRVSGTVCVRVLV